MIVGLRVLDSKLRLPSARSSITTCFIALTLSGCALLSPIPPHNKQELEKHYILIHEEGFPVRIKPGVLWDSRIEMNTIDYDNWINNILAPIDELLTRSALTNEPIRLLFYVHGGLNTYRAEFQRMLALMNEKTGPFPKTTYFPIFINWNSALFDSVIDDLFLVRLGRRREIVGPLTAPFVAAGRFASVALEAPKAWLNSLDNFSEGIRSADSESDDPAHNALTTLEAVALSPVRAVTIPTVQGFGIGAWQIMRRRVELAVASRLTPREAGYASEGAARTLFQRLQEKIDEEQKKNPNLNVEVTFVGHSMGAMLLNRLLTLAKPDLPIKRVVYLAPASRIDDFEHYVLPFVATHPSADIWWFSLARADEARESHYLISPSGTLLVWIDNYFDPVAAGGQTTFGRYRKLTEYYTDWLEKPDDNGVIKFDDKAGPRFNRIHGYRASMKDPKRPKEHGDFDKPKVFQTVLCYVDPSAFKDPRSCPPSPTMFNNSLEVPK
jgi:pimeloyl-ACP methyl ester carboxylesterase